MPGLDPCPDESGKGVLVYRGFRWPIACIDSSPGGDGRVRPCRAADEIIAAKDALTRNMCLRANVCDAGLLPRISSRISSSAIAGRMACLLAAALLTSASWASFAHAQVIEEGGFPVKGGDVWSEPFSLSCPSLLVAGAGESLPMPCTATAAPKEGVRYEWASESGNGLRLLSAPDELSPLFTAPETDTQYAYRLTATGAGVYATVSVTVRVQGASGETAGGPGLLEDCDPLAIPDEPGKGCAEDRGPVPFGIGFEEEGDFLFPEAPGLPDPGSGLDSRTPPRLECPVAVFLDELETGQVECHAWDASGEEYLDFAWEPVGSTTRDYLNNPRLFPEDAPNPLVVAPETPVYETLESFHSGETTFRYRYRLTATSRATGLWSSEEVEVYVSSSRPGVYCPLEIVVAEGETVSLDCEGVDPLSARMDYDEEAASVQWEWEGLWGTGTDALEATHLSAPLFTAPAGSAGKEFHYIASMTTSASGAPRTARRKVTVRVADEEERTQDASAPGSSPLDFTITCEDDAYTEDGFLYMRHEKTASFVLDCEASGGPDGVEPTYAWTGSRKAMFLLSDPDIRNPMFHVPRLFTFVVDTYKYTLTASAGDGWDTEAKVTVEVYNPAMPLVFVQPSYEINEGTPNFTMNNIIPEGGPSLSQFSFEWTGNEDALALLSETGVHDPEFRVPENVDSDTTYEYKFTTRIYGNDASSDITVTVVDIGLPPPVVTCNDPDPVYEGAEDDVTLDCSVENEPSGASYAWTPLGSTSDTALLSPDTILQPTFAVPANVDADTEYTYMVMLSAAGVDAVYGYVTVTVLNKPDILAVCDGNPYEAYEGGDNLRLDCNGLRAPAGSEYAYEWTARGNASDMSMLSATDIASPMFTVPDEIDGDETYKYTLTVRAENAEPGTASVNVTVLNKEPLAVSCTDPDAVYEGSTDVDLDCSVEDEPSGASYVWEGTDIAVRLRGANGPTPTFDVPANVDADTEYEYTLTVRAENADPGTARVTVTVLNKPAILVVCDDNPYEAYEGDDDLGLDCDGSGAPQGSSYEYSWTPRGDTPDISLLLRADEVENVFLVPDEVDETTTYEYLLTVSAENAENGTARVSVTVLNKPDILLACADPDPVYEGSDNIAFDCKASGAPGDDPEYAYVWTARGNASDMSMLSAMDIASPMFTVPDEVDETTTYEYLLTVSLENAENATKEVTVTVLNKEPLALVCTDAYEAYEGSEDITLDCEASGAPGDTPQYAYAWTAQGNTSDAALLSATDIASPAFYVPDEVDETTTYEYLLTTRAENAEDGTAKVSVTVLNKEPLALVCTDAYEAYEGSEDIALDCEASGAPGDTPQYAYVWTAQGDTPDTSLLSATDIASPTFYVPNDLDATTTYEYLLTTRAENAEDGTAEVSVTVLNKEPIALVCTDAYEAYEGSEDITLDCEASGAPGDNPQYTYAWTAQGDTPDTSLLSDTHRAAPAFYVPDTIDVTTTYEYLLTASAENAENGTAEVSVTVLKKEPLSLVPDAIAGQVYVFIVGEFVAGETIADIPLPEAMGGLAPYTYTLTPALPEGLMFDNPTRTISGTPLKVSPRTEYAWQVVDANAETMGIAFFIEVIEVTSVEEPASAPVAESLSLGVTVSASSLDFGVQLADTQASLDPMTDRISTYLSGPYHGGRVTLSPDGSEALGENGEMDLSIELVSPVTLRREGDVEAGTIDLLPQWSLTESCEQLSSHEIGALYTEMTLSEDACRLLRFGGTLDLTGALPGRYAGSIDLILRSGEREETHSVGVSATVLPSEPVITIGPGGVRFSASRELFAGLTEAQNLSIYPQVAFLTGEAPHGAFELSNSSLIPLEISVSARFGYTEATEEGREVTVEDVSASRLGDLSGVVDMHPDVLVLQPGEKELVRYGVKEEALAAMVETGYAAFFHVTSEPHRYARTDRMPEEVTGGKTARVTMRVPGVFVPGEEASQLRATLLSISRTGSLSATFLLETADHPFAGEVVAYDGDGRELGRRETLVYTRSRVRVPLDRIPEEGAVFLRFSPRGSGRAPEPASVEWDAPLGYIEGEIGR